MGRNRKQKLTEQDFERVIENRGLGFGNKESAAQIGISESSVSHILRAFDSIRKEDWNDVVFMCNKSATNMTLLKWASEKLGKDIPQNVLDVFMIRPEKDKTSEPPEPPEKENEALWMLRILETLLKIAETEEKIVAILSSLENKTLPDMVKEITSNINANGDMLNSTLIDIRANTRKRGT